jgi:hypothetical protein
MVLRCMVGIVATALLAGGTAAVAADYQPGEFFNLDLSRAVLSPRPLGPEARFEPVPVEARSDRTVVGARAAATPDLGSASPRLVATRRVRTVKAAERSRGAARTKLAHRRGNPLDAQAMDTRVQTWPCRPGSGALCNWR